MVLLMKKQPCFKFPAEVGGFGVEFEASSEEGELIVVSGTDGVVVVVVVVEKLLLMSFVLI